MILRILIPLFLFNLAVAQNNVTDAEMKKFAQNNLERKACLQDNKINEKIIDSLNTQLDMKDDQIKLKNENIEDYKLIAKKLETIDEVRVVQLAEYMDQHEADKSTIKKQNGRLNFWRIFTPVVVTGVAIVAVIK